MENKHLRKKLTNWDFSEYTHTIEEFASDKGNVIRIDHLRKGDSNIGYVRFVNDEYGLSVFGDFGNWIFCRPFVPSPEGYVSVGYWNEKLTSRQNYSEYDPEQTYNDIEELINAGLHEEYGYDGEELDNIIEWYENLLNYVDDEYEYVYHAYRDCYCPVDREDIPFAKKQNEQLLCVYDAFNVICNRLENENLKNKLWN